ncbi:GNAT family N-acetyltransferase [Nocardioides agariphilus]|uniref:GNAT family N-acetyltransferase n=1 Tax=Nocardioides agariphilus TaxID=433664 RepID=A0A930VPA2_9ACTN|nr:bifunctional helix-turn-helix transcriptional regulator/GNAT family N-acetyltransferase [Nocardioides agariphilus]MBF4770327.1 GNAT family N-acetyltransferase [Nocardioides agariphilus]
MADQHAATVRRFNRTYTQRIGALDDSFLGTGRPLGPSRLLFEIGLSDDDGATVRELRERLGLDSGYLSRLLRSLEADGLVDVRPDPTDRRRRRVRLTGRGRTARRRLDERSEDLARSLVAPLSERQRERLTEALATADLLVRAATVQLQEVSPTDPRSVAAMAAYFAEIGERFGFEPGDAWLEDAEAMTGPDGFFVVATSDGEAVACGGVHRLPDGAAEIKRMWVHGDWRGAGLGARLLRHLEDVVRDRGYDVVRLDTNDTLLEAIAMYERAGYHAIERYNDNPWARRWFEKTL